MGLIKFKKYNSFSNTSPLYKMGERKNPNFSTIAHSWLISSKRINSVDKINEIPKLNINRLRYSKGSQATVKVGMIPKTMDHTK